MDDDALTTVLEDAGLSPYQAAAYVALLDLGAATATDVAAACEVPAPRIYDVFRDLDEMGYVETYQQDSLTVRAHDPERVLGDLRDRSSRYLSAAEEIEERWKRPAIEDHEVSVVKRFETVRKRSRELIQEASDEVVLGTTPEIYRELRPVLAAAHERGVHVNLCLYTQYSEDGLPTGAELDGSCTEARHRDFLAPYLLVVDRQWTCFSPERESVNEYGILVNDRTHTDVFYWFFRSALWETWDTIHADRNAEIPLTYVDFVECLRTVVPLVESGHEVTVTVDGNETATRADTTITGRIVDTYYSGESLELEGDAPLAPLAGRKHFTLETDSGECFDVGGWGARIEDVEARWVTITDVVEP